jgi:phage/plasmid-associated DNA primase
LDQLKWNQNYPCEENSKETFSEVEKWIAHSIQAAGGMKPYALTFIGKEGGGKSWLIELLKKMYGGRVLQTASPERDVWGTYNPLMATAYLVNLNEVDKRNTKGADGKIKQLISEDRITVSSKGQNAYEIDSYNRFILTTNALDGAGTDDNDRRNMIMRCSDSKVGDSDYFKELFSLLENTEVMRAVYKHFRTLDMSTWNPAKAPLKTEYHTTIIGETKSNIQQYMEHFTYKHSTEESVELYGKDIYTDYKQWNEEQGNEYKMALNDLLKKIKLTYRAVIISSKRDNKGMKNTYSILELKRLFNIGELLI